MTEPMCSDLAKHIGGGRHRKSVRNHGLDIQFPGLKGTDGIRPFMSWKRRGVGHETPCEGEFLSHQIFNKLHGKTLIERLIPTQHDRSSRPSDLNSLGERLRSASCLDRKVDAFASQSGYLCFDI